MLQEGRNALAFLLAVAIFCILGQTVSKWKLNLLPTNKVGRFSVHSI